MRECSVKSDFNPGVAKTGRLEGSRRELDVFELRYARMVQGIRAMAAPRVTVPGVRFDQAEAF